MFRATPVIEFRRLVELLATDAIEALIGLAIEVAMAIAADLDKSDRRVIAVIGDGAMSAGMARVIAFFFSGRLKRISWTPG